MQGTQFGMCGQALTQKGAGPMLQTFLVRPYGCSSGFFLPLVVEPLGIDNFLINFESLGSLQIFVPYVIQT